MKVNVKLVGARKGHDMLFLLLFTLIAEADDKIVYHKKLNWEKENELRHKGYTIETDDLLNRTTVIKHKTIKSKKDNRDSENKSLIYKDYRVKQ